MFGINLSNDEQAQQVKDWLKRNSWYLLGIVALIAVIIGGYNYLQFHQKEDALTSGTLLQSVVDITDATLTDPTADAGTYARALDQISEFSTRISALDDDSFAAHVAQIHRAKIMVALNSPFSKVAEVLDKVKNSNYPPVATEALMLLAHAAWSNGDTDDALAMLSRAEVPDIYVAIIEQLRGEIALAAGNTEVAREAWKKASDEGSPSRLLIEQVYFVGEDVSTDQLLQVENIE